MKVLLVALAGAAGALSRYGIGTAVGAVTFPWATLAINLTGSFALGLVMAVSSERGWPEATTVPLAIGFLGAFTTFSTFSVETYTMMRADRLPAAVAYVALSVVGGVVGAGAGYAAGRSLA